MPGPTGAYRGRGRVRALLSIVCDWVKSLTGLWTPHPITADKVWNLTVHTCVGLWAVAGSVWPSLTQRGRTGPRIAPSDPGAPRTYLPENLFSNKFIRSFFFIPGRTIHSCKPQDVWQIWCPNSFDFGQTHQNSCFCVFQVGLQDH